MTRVLRIVREGDAYVVCSVEVDWQAETYGVRNQVAHKFRTPLDAVNAVTATGRSEPRDITTMELCAECLSSYAKHGYITRQDALYALAALDDTSDQYEAPDLLGEFLGRRARRNVDR